MTDLARLVAGRYRLESVIGRGGMGEVWRANDEVLGRRVAIKEVRFPHELSTEHTQVLRHRLMREARLTARLSHPGIVTVHDVVSEDGHPYIVMELLRPHTLADEIVRHSALPPQRVAAIGLELIDALTVAHRGGVVHRDIKPGNVLVRHDGRVVLTDFGIAISDKDPVLTDTGVLVGSPSFMSPERLRGEDVGPAADIWSLGATLYAALEGRPPFRADTTMGTITAVLTNAPAPPFVSGPLRDVLLGMLAKDATWRLTAERARSMLQQASQGVPPLPPTTRATSTAEPAVIATAEQHPEPHIHARHRAEHRTRRGLKALAVGCVLAALAGIVVAAADRLANSPGADPGQASTVAPTTSGTSLAPSTTPSSSPTQPPFTSAALSSFSRGLFDSTECARAEPGRYSVLDTIPDVEAVACVGDTFAAKFFRSNDTGDLRAERDLYRSKAASTPSPVPPPVTGSPQLFDGRRFSFLLAYDGTARLYWDSASCLCGGVLAAPDGDVAALVQFWRGG